MLEKQYLANPVELKSPLGIAYVSASVLVIVASLVFSILAIVNKSVVYCFVLSLVGVAFVLFIVIMEIIRYKNSKKLPQEKAK